MKPSSLSSAVLDIIRNSDLARDPGSVLALAYAVYSYPNSSLATPDQLAWESLTYLADESDEWEDLLKNLRSIHMNESDGVKAQLSAFFDHTFSNLSRQDFLDVYQELDLALNAYLSPRGGCHYMPQALIDLGLLLTREAIESDPSMLVSTHLPLSAHSLCLFGRTMPRLKMICEGPTQIMELHSLVLKSSVEIAMKAENTRVENFEKFGRVLSFPPFGSSRKTLGHDREGCDNGNDLVSPFLSDNGVQCIVVPEGFLYSHRERAFRETLVEHGLLRSVTSLPVGFFPGTMIKTAALVLQKWRGSEFLRLVKLSEDPESRSELNLEKLSHAMTCSAPYDEVLFPSVSEIRQMEFDLTFTRYLPDVEIDLPAGAEIYAMSQLVRSFRGEAAQAESVGKLIRIRDLSPDDRFEPNGFDDVAVTRYGDEDRSGRLRVINGPCVLVSSVYHRSLKADYYPDNDTALMTRRPDLMAFQVKESGPKVDPSWLLMTLAGDEVQEQINRFARGAAQRRVREKDFLGIRIAVPSLEEQQRQLAAARQVILRSVVREKGLEDLLEETQNEFLRDLQIKKHSISQTVSRLREEAEAAQIICSKENYSEKERARLAVYLSRMDSHFDVLHEQMERLTKQTLLGRLEPLDLVQSLQEFCSSNSAQNFECGISVDIESFIEGDESVDISEAGQVVIQIARQDFQELLSNVLSNAMSHGFVEDRPDYEVRIQVRADVSFDGSARAVVEISNNGKPLPKGLTTERFSTRGEHGGRTGRDGLGGYHVHRIMQHVGGEVEILSEPESSFPVTLKLSFPL